MSLKVYRAALKVLTPVFIGGGREASLNRSQYIYDERNKQVYFLDEAKFVKFLLEEGLLDSYAEYVKEAAEAEGIHLSRWLEENRIKDFSKLASEKAGIEADSDVSDLNDVKCFIRNGINMPYIPGSSIKGSLRNMIVSYINENGFEKNKDWKEFEDNLLKYNIESKKDTKGKDGKNKKDYNPLKDTENKKKINRAAASCSPKVRNDRVKNDSLKDAFRFFRVSDSTVMDVEDLFITRTLRLSTERKNGSCLKKLPLYLEYLKPGIKTYFTITLDTSYLKDSQLDFLGTAEGFKKVLDWQEKRIPSLLGDSVFKKKAREENLNYRFSCDERIKPNLILGGQAGFNTKTLVPVLAGKPLEVTRAILHYQFPGHKHQNLDREVSPRTLKLAYYRNRYYVSGLCRVEIIEEVNI